MKQDIDEILLGRFGIAGNTGSYTLGTFWTNGNSKCAYRCQSATACACESDLAEPATTSCQPTTQ